LESQTSLVAQIQVSRPQTYNKRTFMGVAHWHSCEMNYVLRSVNVQVYTKKHRVAKNVKLDI